MRRIKEISTSKTICVLTFMCLSFSTFCQGDDHKNLIYEFSKEVLLSDTINREFLYNHSNVHKNLLNNAELEKYTAYLIALFKSKSEVNDNFSVASYSEVAQRPELRTDALFEDLDYKCKKEVYYLVANDKKDLVWTFIVKKDKIASFFSYWNFGGKLITPLPLRKKSSLKYIKELNKYIGA